MGCVKLIVQYPYLILTAVVLSGIGCFVLLYFFADIPDFRDPKLGFECRGTEISRRMLAYELLLDKTVADPSSPLSHKLTEGKVQTSAKNTTADNGEDDDTDDDSEDDYAKEFFETRLYEEESYFCDDPRPEYARVVFVSNAFEDGLLSADKIKSMCGIEDETIRRSDAFERVCVRAQKTQTCCRSWSLGNYIALLSNKSSCYEIDDTDVERVLEMIVDCRDFFRTHSHIPPCWTVEEAAEVNCPTVPKRCRQHSAIYHILYYLTDTDVVDENLLPHVSYAVTFLPIAAGIGAKEIYYQMERNQLSDGITRVVGVDFGIKQDVFDQYLVTDMVWFGIGLACVIVLVWLHTGSFFIMIMTIILIFLSLEISFFVYTVVFRIKFFPFMNLLIIVILIGIGVDDVLIYCRIWHIRKSQKNSMTLEKLVKSTLKHAALSMSVTSLTTAVAFFSSYLSSVTVLRCFAIFAGTAVIVNFILMVIMMPAVIVVHEKWWLSGCNVVGRDSCRKRMEICCNICDILGELFVSAIAAFTQFFVDFLPCVIVKFRFLWLTVFGLLGVGAAIVVLYHPKLKLPTTNEFQLFADENLFEVYDLKIKNNFWFERALRNNTPTMPITIVWGVQKLQTYSSVDPLDKGELVFDDTFDISTPEAQTFLLKFCRQLRGTKYYLSEPGIQLTNCFMENFQRFTRRSCRSLNGTILKQCCESQTFPLTKDVFDICIKEYIPILADSAARYFSNPNGGLRFVRGNDRPVAVIVEFSSNQQFSLNYSQMQNFYTYMNDHVVTTMQTAPDTMKNGWFVSYLSFFDLQDNIANGTPIAIGVSISIVFAVALVTTLNVLITIYSMLSITAAIFVTVAILVLIGWELNVLESVTISLAIGLSIDYALHYGLAYRLSPDVGSHLRVTGAVRNIGGPVAMAALTTFLVGASMMPSTVLAYRQLGVFLMIVISVSWVYATFFFLSLLAVVGPKGSFSQLHLPSVICLRSSYAQNHVDKTVYAVSDSTLSSSSITNHANNSEAHEQLTAHLPLPSNGGSPLIEKSKSDIRSDLSPGDLK